MLVDDPLLISALQAGDEAAFVMIVRQWSPVMLRVAMAYVHSYPSAEEVVQEAWLGVVRSLPGFEGRAQLRTWVFRILVNVARRRGRTDRRAHAELAAPSVDPARFRDDDDEGFPRHWRPDAAPADWGPEPVLLAAEFRAVLERALAELPERQRAVVELRDVHGLDSEEVCELLELTPANQRVLLHRGRSRLRAALEGVLS